MSKSKAQSSLEFLMIFGIGFSIIIIIGGLFLTYSSGAKETLDQQQIDRIGQEIISSIEQIYFLGNGNRLTLNFNFPAGVENFTINHANNGSVDFDYLNITYFYSGGVISEIFTTKEAYTRFNCTQCYVGTDINWFNVSDFSEGSKTIRITSKGDYVSLDFVKE